jgi:hypothetical protein
MVHAGEVEMWVHNDVSRLFRLDPDPAVAFHVARGGDA